jgi:hypothetical protein
MNIKSEKEEVFENVQVGDLVEVIHLGFSQTRNVNNIKILTYGYVNSKTIGEDSESCFLEVNGNMLNLDKIVEFVDVFELGGSDD